MIHIDIFFPGFVANRSLSSSNAVTTPAMTLLVAEESDLCSLPHRRPFRILYSCPWPRPFGRLRHSPGSQTAIWRNLSPI